MSEGGQAQAWRAPARIRQVNDSRRRKKGCEELNSAIRKRKKRRLCRSLMFFLLLTLMAGGSFCYISNRLPDSLKIASIAQAEDVRMPFSGLVREEVVGVSSLSSSNIPSGAVKIKCSILGVIPVKTVDVREEIPAKVIPCGNTVGIFMETRGILVVGTGIVGGLDGLDYEPALNIVQSGDYITAVDGRKVGKKEDLIQAVNDCGGEPIELTVRRNDAEINLEVNPVCTGKMSTDWASG